MGETNLDESGSTSDYELALRHFNVGNMKLDGGSPIEAATEEVGGSGDPGDPPGRELGDVR